MSLVADCAQPPEADRLVREAVAELGHLDILVNAVGAARAGSFLALTEEEWAQSLTLKLMGQIRCCRATLPHMQRQRWGRIINISGSQWKWPMPTSMPAGVANAGLVNFTKSLAELAAPYNVLVNVVNPGPIATRRIENTIEHRAAQLGLSREAARAQILVDVALGRMGQPAEVAHLVVFLASELASRAS